MMQVDGKTYGLPQDTGPLVYFYNQKAFDELGIKVPKTKDELIEAAKTAAASGKYIMDYEADEAGNIFAGLANASDPWYTVKNDAWVVNTNGSGSQAFAETFQELIDNKATLTNPRWVPSFDASLQDGTLIGNIGAAWEAPLFKDSAGDTGKGDWRVTQIGDWFGNGTSTGPDGGSGVAVLKGCEHKAEAMEFLDWFNTQVEDLTSQGLIVAASTETAKTPESWNEFYGGQRRDEGIRYCQRQHGRIQLHAGLLRGLRSYAGSRRQGSRRFRQGGGRVPCGTADLHRHPQELRPVRSEVIDVWNQGSPALIP